MYLLQQAALERRWQGDVDYTAGTQCTAAGFGAVLPSAKGGVLLIDCGANIDCKPAFLQQFAVMGSIYMKAVMGIENPRVGLINNGCRRRKGQCSDKRSVSVA